MFTSVRNMLEIFLAVVAECLWKERLCKVKSSLANALISVQASLRVTWSCDLVM